MQLTRCRTQQILAIENILARQTGGTMRSNDIKQLTEDGVDELGLPEDVALALKANLSVMHTLQMQKGNVTLCRPTWKPPTSIPALRNRDWSKRWRIPPSS